MNQPTAGANERLADVVSELALTAPVQLSKMFGMPSAKRSDTGKAFMGAFDDDLIFRLDGAALQEALDLPGARNFDPMGGRPMRQWVQVPPEHADRYPTLAQAALDALG